MAEDKAFVEEDLAMDKFLFSYPTKVYFGKGSVEQAFEKSAAGSEKPSCWLMAAAP